MCIQVEKYHQIQYEYKMWNACRGFLFIIIKRKFTIILYVLDKLCFRTIRNKLYENVNIICYEFSPIKKILTKNLNLD